MSASLTLPPGISPSLRARFDRLPPDAQADVLARLGAHRRARSRTRIVLVPLQLGAQTRASDRAPLVVMPSMFGTVADWRTFFDRAALDRSVYGLEMTGAEPFAVGETSLEEIAAAAVRVMLAQLPGRRWHLAGYSFGGRLAYEVGRQLVDAGEPPLSTTIVDAASASMPHGRTLRDWLSIAVNTPRWLRHHIVTEGALGLGRRLAGRVNAQADPFLSAADALLSAEDAAAYARLHRVFKFPRVPQAYRRRLIQNERAFRAYRARSAPLRVTYVHGRVRSLIHAADVDGGWRALVPSELLTVHALPGNHLTAFLPGGREPLLALLQQEFERADRPGSAAPGVASTTLGFVD